MTTDQMRVELFKHYSSSPTWLAKLKKMPDGQVQAIYFRHKNQGVIK